MELSLTAFIYLQRRFDMTELELLTSINESLNHIELGIILVAGAIIGLTIGKLRSLMAGKLRSKKINSILK
jgi:hypothetical protein